MVNFLTRTGDLLLPKQVLKILETYHIGGPKSLVYVTNWSILHFISGIIVGYILYTYYEEYDYYWTGFWVHNAWEFWQIVIQNTPYTLRGFIDILMDTFLFMSGMIIFPSLFTGNQHEYR